MYFRIVRTSVFVSKGNMHARRALNRASAAKVALRGCRSPSVFAVLYLAGGWWLDADVRCLDPIDSLAQRVTEGCVRRLQVCLVAVMGRWQCSA